MFSGPSERGRVVYDILARQLQLTCSDILTEFALLRRTMLLALSSVMNLSHIASCGKALFGFPNRPLVGNLRTLTLLSFSSSQCCSSSCRMFPPSKDLDGLLPLTRKSKWKVSSWEQNHSLYLLSLHCSLLGMVESQLLLSWCSDQLKVHSFLRRSSRSRILDSIASRRF